MTLQISTNTAAARASYNLGKNNSMLQRSFDRLSSGKKLVSPIQDPGSLAVSMKLSAAVNRLAGAQNNSQNAMSFLEVQDGMLETVGNIIDRMSELKGLASQDPMKSEQDKASYDNEFRDLQVQLYDIAVQKFNGVSLFATTTTTGGAMTFGTHKHTVSVFTSDRGAAGSVVSLNKSALSAAITFTSTTDATNGATGSGITIAAADSSSAIDIGNITVSFFTKALENIATLRAENGATMTRLQFAEDHLRLSSANLEAANSRIMDVDVATESTALAKYNILSQASAAMLAQANSSQNTALMLLG